MFNKLKQFKDLRNQAKTLQNALAEESVTLEKNGVKITIDGNFNVSGIQIIDNLPKEKLENTIKELFNEAVKKIQRIIAQKMQTMGNLGNFNNFG